MAGGSCGGSTADAHMGTACAGGGSCRPLDQSHGVQENPLDGAEERAGERGDGLRRLEVPRAAPTIHHKRPFGQTI